jgi:hypothetical protein
MMGAMFRMHVGLIAGSLLLLQPARLCGQEDVPAAVAPSGRGIWANLEVQQPNYLTGDTVRIHITLINRSDTTAWVSFAPPQDLLRLTITRDGQAIRPEVGPEGYAGITLAWIELRPNTPRAITTDTWLSLIKWGYRIREPGDYAIQAVPLMYDERHPIQSTTEVRSNTARFVVRQR